jgi:hypothetical protein
MKKILFVAVFGLIGLVSNAQKNDEVLLQLNFDSYGLNGKSHVKDLVLMEDIILKDLQNDYIKAGGNIDRIKAVITLTACDKTVTLTFNDTFTWREILQVCAGAFIELCHPCED